MYTGANEFSSVFVELSQFQHVLEVVGHSGEDLFPVHVYNAYNNEKFIIKFVAFSLSSGSASFIVSPCK